MRVLSEDGVSRVTVRFFDGFAPNARVPEDRRLRLEVGARVWTTHDFDIEASRAVVTVRVRDADEGILTAYVCRADRCARRVITLHF